MADLVTFCALSYVEIRSEGPLRPKILKIRGRVGVQTEGDRVMKLTGFVECRPH